MEYKKSKSAAKVVKARSKELEKTILDTMQTVSDVVGGTLGPGGHPVLIERQEYNLPASITKDGVTVFRSLGFTDPVAHAVMEAARDCAVRTASEAGDGTTTATILSEALVRYTLNFCRENPGVSPQSVIRDIQKTLKQVVEPAISRISIKTDLESAVGRSLLKSVACISGNGDVELADAVMDCFDITGDDGNVTIIESSGPSHYEVDRIEGFPVSMGYEESCAKFYPSFINDPGNQKTYLEKPCFILYFGRITEAQTLAYLLEKIGHAWMNNMIDTHNVVLVATGFSETVLATLALNFVHPSSINVFPLLVPPSAIQNGQMHFMEDLAAVVGAKIYDPITAPLDKADIAELGNIIYDENDGHYRVSGIESFECGRFRSTVLGYDNSDLILLRADEVRSLMENAESELDKALLQERLAKLTGGVAKLKVIGASSGELKERRDRAEDAVCAVRGALKHGCLYGGGFGLVYASGKLDTTLVNEKILKPAMLEPVKRLLRNVGVREEALDETIQPIKNSAAEFDQTGVAIVFNAAEAEHVNAAEAGIFDSTPAVLEAMRNSISIATLLGTLGGVVVFPRDEAFERVDARDEADFKRNSSYNPSDERP